LSAPGDEAERTLVRAGDRILGMTPPEAPRHAALILLDSLNRHMLGCYGGGEFDTPNLDAFAAGAVRFERHYAGSLPCMPARHDLLCGALDFLWKPWGSIELWEEPITTALRRAGVVSVLISDHPHLFEVGGENYHADFSAWRYERGHESDPWRTRPDPSWLGAPSFGRGTTPYDRSRGWFRGEADFPGPRTMAAAARWLEEEAGDCERFFLFVDEFDPHEPFDTPEPWASRYDPGWTGPHLVWPPYVDGGVRKGALSEREARQVRACYGAKLSMIDHWLGRVLGALAPFADDAVVIVTTDHGHYLGEKDVWGKPGVPVQEPLGHIPLLVRWPGVAARAERALTTSADVFATLADLFGVSVKQRTHGRSLARLLRGEERSVREWALAGIYGRQVTLVDGAWNYARGPAGANAPLSLFSNRWSTMPIPHLPDLRLPLPDERAFLDRMPGSSVPVIRQPFREGDLLPFWSTGTPPGNHLWHVAEDPEEVRDLAGGPEEKALEEKLRAALAEVEAPGDQLARLGLA
jgi:arylsulfatase A-like enzyme